MPRLTFFSFRGDINFSLRIRLSILGARVPIFCYTLPRTKNDREEPRPRFLIRSRVCTGTVDEKFRLLVLERRVPAKAAALVSGAEKKNIRLFTPNCGLRCGCALSLGACRMFFSRWPRTLSLRYLDVHSYWGRD